MTRRARVRKLASLLSGFSANVLLNSLTAVAVIPVIIAISGPGAWAGVAVGQSAGSIGAVILALGWGFNGPTLVAVAGAVGRAEIVRHSLAARLLVLPLVGGLSLAATLWLAPGDPVVSAGSCLAVLVPGLGFSWFFIGERRSGALLLMDATPRALGAIVGVVLLVLTGVLAAFVVIQVLFAAAGVLASLRTLTRRYPAEARRVDIKGMLADVRAQAFAGLTVATSTVYLALPTLVLALLAPSAIPAYAIADRIARFSLVAVTPMYQWLQSWVPSAAPGEIGRRIRATVLASVLTAIVLAVALFVSGHWIASVLTSGRVALNDLLIGGIAVSVGMSAISRGTGMVALLALERDRAVALSAVLGAVVAVPAMLLLVPPLGAAGAALAVAISEAIVTATQSIVLRGVLRSSRAGRSTMAGPGSAFAEEQLGA
ncbi:polysaccharide biosynthesis C-terminal domain-containing protein [Naasia aerilata]|uniref:O-antigen/teichoic acid export membrane protein n=1 Tax=Naasia aerilata TaxID=1162966 RepID=A0ABN6XRT6_9MICO|nr:polysaccharide biosynthesis C-terminal domain-containing protein [Naasia aerilata]BDZ44140.1 hypothetical protein GCM10025866_00490 [Naasia aerilata]BDZ47752.1 hypothetical protein GCM10025866_36610 [Naasia aerilata]